MQRLDRHLRSVAGRALERHGHAYASLISHWPAIVGEELAQITRPERLRRPARTEGSPAGATLVLRAAEGRAIEVEHEALRILERINGFFGYGALAALKVVQGPMPERRARGRALPEPPEAAARAVDERVGGIADPRLKDALRRLGRSRAVSDTSR
jgi:hypothetical protein